MVVVRRAARRPQRLHLSGRAPVPRAPGFRSAAASARCRHSARSLAPAGLRRPGRLSDGPAAAGLLLLQPRRFLGAHRPGRAGRKRPQPDREPRALLCHVLPARRSLSALQSAGAAAV